MNSGFVKGIKRFFLRVFALCALVPGWLYMEILWQPKIYYTQGAKKKKVNIRHIKGKGIIMCNHQWWFDAPFICTLCLSRQVSSLTAKEAFSGIRRPLMHTLGCIPVDREAFDMESLNECVRRLENGGVVLSFPEGRMNYDDELLTFKPGTAYMAIHSGAPIYPVYIEGNYQKFQRLQIMVGEPIDIYKEFDGDTGSFARSRATKRLYNALCDVKNELEVTIDSKYRQRAKDFRRKFHEKLTGEKIKTPPMASFIEQWEYKEPTLGAQIRVKRPTYYHHGIYIGNGRVINFSEGSIGLGEESYSQNEITEIDISEFLKGGYVETRVYSKQEQKYLNDPQKVVEIAKSHLGEGGYNMVLNNCEHFSNLCAFNVKYSEVDKLEDFKLITSAER